MLWQQHGHDGLLGWIREIEGVNVDFYGLEIMLSLLTRIILVKQMKEGKFGSAAKGWLQLIPLFHTNAAEVLTGNEISPQLHELPIVEDVTPSFCIRIFDGLLIYLRIFWLKLHQVKVCDWPGATTPQLVHLFDWCRIRDKFVNVGQILV